MIKKVFTLVFLLLSLMISAQENSVDPEMADSLRANGKINVVVAVIAIIFVSIICFLVYLERRVKKLESSTGSHTRHATTSTDTQHTKI